MAMSRKDYVLLAEALKNAMPVREYEKTQPTIDTWRNTVEVVSRALIQTNPNYNRRRFETAAGLYE